MYFERTWQRFGSMERKLGLIMSTGNDMPVRNQESLAAVLTEESGCFAQRRAGFLREYLQFGDPIRVLVGISHIGVGQFQSFYRAQG